MNDFYKDLKKQLKKKNINIINTDYYSYIQDWKSWYIGYVDGFHNYNVRLADGNTAKRERLTMNMAKKVCEDRTKLIWSENVRITLDDDSKTQKLWEILDSKKNNISIMMPKMIELANAQGTVAFTEFQTKDGETVIEYIEDAMSIVPYSYDNYNITGMCVLDQFTEEEKGKTIYYTHITYHEFDGTNYTKLNELYKSRDVSSLGKEVSFEEKYPNVKEVVKYDNVERPHFQIYRPNIANNYDISTPMGISIFANSIDRLKSIDTKYDSFNNEFIQGKKRILVDRNSLKSSPQIDKSGNVTNVLYFDKNDDTYVAIRGMEGQPVKEIDFNLRVEEHVNALNSDLSWLGANMGFGESFYSFDGSRMKTATEVINEDSEAFRTMQSDSIVLKDVIYDLVMSICDIEGIEVKNINIELDTTRFVDKEKEYQRFQYELSNGLMSKVDYLIKVYGLEEEEAIKKVEEINSENPSIEDLIGKVEE